MRIQPIKSCLLLALGWTLSLSAASTENDRAIIEENQGKALLIYNIAKFTVWPTKASHSEPPFTYALWDDAALTQAFQALEDLKTQGRTVRITVFNPNSTAVDCEVLIIPTHQLQAFILTQDEINNRAILTVTTDKDVFNAGAMVLVEVIEDHLSFSVNLGRVKASGLEISGNLLRHAQEVNF